MKTKDTRKRILEAGLTLFSKKGYLGATTKEIAAMASVAEVTLFRHFSSKEVLFNEMINTYSFLPALKGMLPKISRLDYRNALHEIAKKFLQRLSERRELIRIMHSEIHLYPVSVKKMYHNFIDEIFKTLASYFRALQKKRVLKGFDPELGARAFLGMFFAFFNAQEFLSRKEIKAMDTDTVIREFIEIFISGTEE